MQKTLFALSFGFAAVIFLTHPGIAQTPPGAQCDARQKVLDLLGSKYGETRHGMGIAANNTVMEVYASDKTGTWTITVTLPTGVTCLVASGQGFEALADQLPAEGTNT